MAGEVVRAFGTTKVLEAAGASIANNAVGSATTSYSTGVDGGDFPNAEFVLGAALGVAVPVEGTSVVLMARPLGIDGAANAQVPEASRPDRVVGAFVVDNVTATQYVSLFAYDLPRNASYHLLNSATGTAIQAGWTLKVTPMAYKVA